jgi:hypothetical protein
MVGAAARQFGQLPMQLDRIGRGEGSVGGETGGDDAERSQAGGAAAEMGPELAREVDRRGLALGARDGGDDARLGAVKARGDVG